MGPQLLPLCHSNPHYLLVCDKASEQPRLGLFSIYLDLDLWATFWPHGGPVCLAWPFFPLFLFLFICWYCSLTRVKSVTGESQTLSKGISWPCHLMQHVPTGHGPLEL